MWLINTCTNRPICEAALEIVNPSFVMELVYRPYQWYHVRTVAGSAKIYNGLVQSGTYAQVASVDECPAVGWFQSRSLCQLNVRVAQCYITTKILLAFSVNLCTFQQKPIKQNNVVFVLYYILALVCTFPSLNADVHFCFQLVYIVFVNA